MDTGLLHLHNILRWVILILLLVTAFQAFTKKEAVAKTSLFLMIAAHTMLLIGLYQWIAGRYGLIKPLPEGISMMKDKTYRFFQLEHPLMMIISIVLITIARKKAKLLQYKKVTGFVLAALFLILAAVPWPFRDEAIRRALFPGM
jgi:hypothetical protein